MKTRTGVLIAIFLLCARGAGAQAPDFSQLDVVVRQELTDAGVPGATIAIVSGGRVVYVKGYGVASVETGAAMTPDLLFRLGSTTKMFTAAALAALADKGTVDLKRPVGDYITGLHPSIARVTGHQLLSHTSGMLDEAPMFGSHDEAALTKNVLSWRDDRFFTEPGRIYSYSNPGYWLAGAVIEAVSGRLYADQMHESLFAPLGMTSTTLRPTMAMTFPIAQGHDVISGPSPLREPPGLPEQRRGATRSGPPRATTGGGTPTVVRPAANNAASWPAGSIFSNVLDLSRFVIAFVSGGRVEDTQALSPAVIRMLSTPAVRIPGSDNEYGYGLSLGTYRGVRIIQHGGSRSGYGSTIRMVPERQFGVIVLANRTGAGMSRSAEKAMEVVLGLPPAPTPEPAGAAASMTDAEMSAYAGRYSQGVRTMEIVKKDGKLFLRQGTRDTEIRRTAPHRFTASLFFVTAADGRVEYLHTGGRTWRKVS